MKIIKNTLKESKENLPISVLTDLTAQSWSQIGMINDQIKMFKTDFKGAKKVTDILQDLADAYLIAVGQLESLLSTKDYLDFSVDDKELKESLEEDTNIQIDNVTIAEPEIEVKVKDIEPVNQPEIKEIPAIETDIIEEPEIVKSEIPEAEVGDAFNIEMPEADTSIPMDRPDHIEVKPGYFEDKPAEAPLRTEIDTIEIDKEQPRKDEPVTDVSDDEFFNMF